VTTLFTPEVPAATTDNAAFGDARLPERFWEKVHQTADGCWEWTAGNSGNGYGRIWVDGSKRAAHRVAYEAIVGPILPGLQLDHLCRNRGCVRPCHLEPVTPRVNTLRGVTLGAANAAKTACPQGHPFSEANTHTEPTGKRRCRTCRRAADAQRRAARKVVADD
jgi:hypothetical protein